MFRALGGGLGSRFRRQMAQASGGDDVATCLGSWPEEESDDFVFKPLGVVRAWKASGGSGAFAARV